MIYRCFLHIIQAAESYESLCYFVLGAIDETQLILYSHFLACCFFLSLCAYFLSNVKTAASLPNAQDITTLRLKEKAADQSACFDPAKAISSSWVSVIFGNQLRLRSLNFRRCEIDILFDRRRTAEQVKLELKLAKGFSSNIKGDGPMSSEMRYVRQKYKPKRRRLSRKNLKRDAEHIPNKSLPKRQRIYNNTAPEHVRVSKRTLDNAELPVSKSSRYSGQLHLLNLLKRDPPESLDKPLTKRRKILKVRKIKRFRRTSTYQMHVSVSHLFKKKRRKTMPSDPTESNTSKTPRSYTDSPQSFRALSKVRTNKRTLDSGALSPGKR